MRSSTPQPPKVSVNLCCYNSERFLEETLQSIFAQSYTDWELAIVNDGSTDSTEEIIKRFTGTGKRIVYHYQPNAGLGKARNRALELSSGEFIALIDHDDLWLPTKLEAQVRMLERNLRLGLVYCDGYTIDSKGQVLTRYSDKHRLFRGCVFDHLYQGRSIPPVSAVVRKGVLDRVGGFLDFKTAEDFDLFLRIAYEYPVDYVDEPLYKYRVHEENLSQKGDRHCYFKEGISILESWMKRIPPHEAGRYRRVRKAAALAHGRYASWLFDQGHVPEAQEHFARSLEIDPSPFRYLRFVLTMFPRPLIHFLLRKIRGLRIPSAM